MNCQTPLGVEIGFAEKNEPWYPAITTIPYPDSGVPVFQATQSQCTIENISSRAVCLKTVLLGKPVKILTVYKWQPHVLGTEQSSSQEKPSEDKTAEWSVSQHQLLVPFRAGLQDSLRHLASCWKKQGARQNCVTGRDPWVKKLVTG